MTDPASNGSVSIRLADNWDAALSYDVLEQDAATAARPIFVGRKELLGPIVNAIGQPDRRGTYLISGYRGAGKTSLVIEAARLAREKLEPERRILPVVLNVSEVSASLSDASRSTVGPLQIDARRLLTALLRQLRNKVPVEGTAPKSDEEKLARKIDWAYTKADAAQYVQRSQQRIENRRSELIESRIQARLANVLKLGGALLAVAAVALGLGVLATPVAGGIAALAGLATVSFGWSRTASQASEGRDTAEIELTRDNSVHQLENELKDIFIELYKRKRRTIVVLEELDKVEDSEGRQLEAVIRYFKNLFTQAPALFFFITDKQYYDLIETRIEEARRNRTYSIEHTFFTHRVFVNRPTVGACLDYLRSIAADEEERKAIEAIVEAESNRVRLLSSMDLRERLLRVLLFRAEDHIFDLKNAIRGYVNVHENESFLECDDESLPSREQALATFQFLVERKARSFGFRGGRDYANEVLRNCLFAVFDDMDPGTQRELSEFGPRKGAGGDQLGAAEEKQIADAVASLIEDLERGGALERDPPHFTWKENAAIRFSPTADLDPHEKELVAGLERSIKVLSVLTEDGPLHGVLSDPDAAPGLVKELEDRIQQVESAEVAIPNEDALARAADSEARVDRLLGQVYDEHGRRLSERIGRQLELVGTSRRVWRLPRTGPGEVLLVYGSDERVMQAVVSHVAGTSERLAIVQLVPVVDRGYLWDVQLGDVRRAWRAQLGSLAAPYVCTTLAIDEDRSAEEVEARWTEAAADELLVAELWVDRAWRRMVGTPEQTPEIPDGPFLVRRSGTDVAEEPEESVELIIADWVRSGDQLLCWVTKEPSLAAVAALFDEPLVSSWDAYAYLPATAWEPGHAATALWDLPAEKAGPRLDGLRRLIEARRVVVGLSPHMADDLPPLPPTAAVAVHAPKPVDLSETVSPPVTVRTLRVGGDPEEAYRLGVLVHPWDPQRGRQLVEEAADGDHSRAMSTLALWLLSDDPEAAQRWRERLVETSDTLAIQLLAEAMETDGVRDVGILEALAQLGSSWGMARLAHERIESEPEQAKRWIDQLIETADVGQIEWLAEALREQSPDDSRRLYERAASLGRVGAARFLALWPDAHVASTWRTWLVEHRDIGATIDVARIALREDPDSAEEWFKLASDSGDEKMRRAIADVLADAAPPLAEQLRAAPSAG